MVKRSICILLASVVAGCAAGDAEPSADATGAVSPLTRENMRVSGPAQVMTGPLTAGGLTPGQSAATPPPAARADASSASAAPVTTALPQIPAGARFSIFCESFEGPDHVQFSTNVKNLLVKNTKLRDWYVIHQSGQSSLYHGYYAEFNADAADKAARRDAERAQRDHKLVESIPSPQDPTLKMFARSIFVPLDAPDPDAPPAWNLTNAPGFWTVQVAAFRGADRKRQTVEAVRQAREQNVPAFYYHGATVSSVCVGSWDRGAIKDQGVTRPGNVDQDPTAGTEDDFIVNYTGQDVSKTISKTTGPNGKPMKVYQAKMDVLDPTLLATLKQYPAHAVDGYEVMLKGTDASGKEVSHPRPSMVVRIPREDLRDGTTAAASDEPEPTLIRRPGGNPNLGSRLKGIGQ